MQVFSDKHHVRSHIQQVFMTQEAKDLHKKSIYIQGLLVSNPRLQDASMVILYDAMSDEPNLETIMGQFDQVFVVDPTMDAKLIQLPPDACFVIPARAMTMDGKRVGRGGGWYDASLADYPDAYKIGVCFDFQIFDDLPQDSWDVKMDEVVVG